MKTIKIHTPKSNCFMTGKYSDYGKFVVHEFSITKETGKAIQISRFIEYKNKKYTCWIPKSAFEFFKNDDGSDDDSEAFLKDFVYNKDYTEWFLTAN